MWVKGKWCISAIQGKREEKRRFRGATAHVFCVCERLVSPRKLTCICFKLHQPQWFSCWRTIKCSEYPGEGRNSEGHDSRGNKQASKQTHTEQPEATCPYTTVAVVHPTLTSAMFTHMWPCILQDIITEFVDQSSHLEVSQPGSLSRSELLARTLLPRRWLCVAL